MKTTCQICKPICAALLLMPLASYGLEPAPLHLLEIIHTWNQRAAASPDQRCKAGEEITLAVDLAANGVAHDGLQISHDSESQRLKFRYAMTYNDVTEGWNWHPEDALKGQDYYTFKYLPLGSVEERHGQGKLMGINGEQLDYTVQWRYDYLFTFDNPDDFYPPEPKDDAEFATSLTTTADEAKRLAAGNVRMAVQIRLSTPCITDSNTYWRATLARPIDLTMKKRYLVGKLQAVIFYDAATGRELARHLPR